MDHGKSSNLLCFLHKANLPQTLFYDILIRVCWIFSLSLYLASIFIESYIHFEEHLCLKTNQMNKKMGG